MCFCFSVPSEWLEITCTGSSFNLSRERCSVYSEALKIKFTLFSVLLPRSRISALSSLSCSKGKVTKF